MIALAHAYALTLAHALAVAVAPVDVGEPDGDPAPGLPRDPYAGLAPIPNDPFETTPPPEARSWLLLSVGIGGGTSRLGPVATGAAFEGHFFVLPRLSIGARLGGLVFGEPDGNGATARHVTGLVGYRVRLSGDEDGSRAEVAHVTWLHVAGGAGWIGLKGYVKTGGLRSDFAVDRVLVAGRAAVVWARGVFGTSIGLDVLGAPGQGFAVLPTIGFGFLF